MRKLASIKQVSATSPIEGADRIEVTHIDGWNVITGKGEFKPGDKVIYFEIDSYLPVDERFEFLRARCYREFSKNGKVFEQGFRIKTMKLRGVISQGLVMSPSAFPEIGECEVGDDLTEKLGVRHYDEISAPFIPVKVPCGDKFSDFPFWIPKTDEERIQNLVEYFDDPVMLDKHFEITEKNDGSSCTAFYAPSKTGGEEDWFGVCSRNMRLKRNPETSKFWSTILKMGIEEKLKKYYHASHIELALQGELVGPGIQSNRDLYPDFEWHVFRIWDITHQKFLEPTKRRELCKLLDIPHVAVIDPDCRVFVKFKTCEEMLKFAEGKTVRGNEREGVVFKEINTDNPITFKAVSNRYLLKQD